MPALAAVMLTACATSGPTEVTPGPAANPVIEVRREVQTVCPAELDNAPAKQPAPAPDAVVEYNGPGRDWLAETLAWGGALFATIIDARAQCPNGAAGQTLEPQTLDPEALEPETLASQAAG